MKEELDWRNEKALHTQLAPLPEQSTDWRKVKMKKDLHIMALPPSADM